MKRIGVNVRLEVIQKTALLGKAKILRKVLSLYEEGKERPGSRGELFISCFSDVNECATEKYNCDNSSKCHNTKGSFLCICREPGYFWNGVNCTVHLSCQARFPSKDYSILILKEKGIHFRLHSSFRLKTVRSAKPFNKKINFKGER
ncbi:unnamed protein product, partial [Porites lobata]